jgi:hypothetical protein
MIEEAVAAVVAVDNAHVDRWHGRSLRAPRVPKATVAIEEALCRPVLDS